MLLCPLWIKERNTLTSKASGQEGAMMSTIYMDISVHTVTLPFAWREVHIPHKHQHKRVSICSLWIVQLLVRMSLYRELSDVNIG